MANRDTQRESLKKHPQYFKTGEHAHNAVFNMLQLYLEGDDAKALKEKEETAGVFSKPSNRFEQKKTKI